MAERNSAKKKLAVATEAEESGNAISELERTKDNIVDSLGLLEYYVKEFDKTEKIQVGAWAEKLEQFYNDYRRIVAKLESFSTEEEPVDLRGERIDFDTRYYALRAFYMNKLSKSSGSASVNPQSSVRPLNIRLPEIILPKFSGRLEDWCVFRDTFESAVGSRDDISAVEKMHYLKGLVQGEAARILDPIRISEQGYKDAWRSLRLRFENKRQLIKCHIRALFDTPTMRKESAEELLALVDRVEQQISVLKSLGEPADRWSSLLMYLLSVRLDPSTLREWENHYAKLDADNIAAVLGGTARDVDHINEDSTAMLSYVSMVNYLQNYARVLQAVSPIVSQSAPYSKPPRPLPPPTKFASFPAAAQSESSRSAAANVIQSSKPCAKCGQAHCLYQCPEFRKMNVAQRSELVRQNRLCMNCMRSNSHYARTCSGQRCRVCSKKHHTLLHLDSDDSGVDSGSQSSNTSCCVALQQHSSVPQPQIAPAQQFTKSATSVAVQQQSPSTSNNYNVHGSSGNPQYTLVTHSAGTIPEAVFLPTAMVNIRDSRGRVCTVRCLLDCASQRSFVSKAVCDRLKSPLVHLPHPVTVSGIGNATTSVEFQSTLSIFSRVSPFSIEDTVLVLPSITVKLPQSTVDTSHWAIPHSMDLADPTFAESGYIDVILGAAHFLRVLRYGRVLLGDDLPLLQSTEFGWVVSGKCELSNNDRRRCQFSNTISTVTEMVNTYEVNAVEEELQPPYFLPHHAAMNPESTTNEICLVSDAPCRSIPNSSFNDVLLTAPTIKGTLVTIVLRFGFHHYIISANIERMYRRVPLHKWHQPLQRILWRDDPVPSLTVYQLRTVTSGTSSAPFLVTRVDDDDDDDDEEKTFPISTPTEWHDFSANKQLTGSDSNDSLNELYREIITMLASAALPLRQWSSYFADQEPPDIIDRYHSIRQVLRVAALLWRFCVNCRHHKRNGSQEIRSLTSEENDRTLLMLIRKVQGQCCMTQTRKLTSSGQTNGKSKLRIFHPPFVDGIIRVGGRLYFARIPIDERHPMAGCTANHRSIELICLRECFEPLNADPVLLMFTLRQRFWHLGGRIGSTRRPIPGSPPPTISCRQN
ncbi:uncharacterized protein LOC129773486 [Toxorhynchites rutilus septentrionalis]|uniref:uncharacterized protein LOC129773486 n=1 Tax=Toxorhynchites rutilus septentrionalis TaxID=329112 RepID=UPI00247A497C|nr:uncharacterized protein LOC129773486 [Toxorhynchites rutilus septentrionalis]